MKSNLLRLSSLLYQPYGCDLTPATRMPTGDDDLDPILTKDGEILAGSMRIVPDNNDGWKCSLCGRIRMGDVKTDCDCDAESIQYSPVGLDSVQEFVERIRNPAMSEKPKLLGWLLFAIALLTNLNFFINTVLINPDVRRVKMWEKPTPNGILI